MAEKNKSIVKEFISKSPAIDDKKGKFASLLSTPDIDRDGERILPSAFEKRLPIFMQNPVFLACHQSPARQWGPFGNRQSCSGWIEPTVGLWAIVQFAESELAEKYWQLYRDGFMKAVSVGFIPIKSHEEIIGGKRVLTFDEVEWIELSACAMPSNRGALARSKANKLAFVEAKA